MLDKKKYNLSYCAYVEGAVALVVTSRDQDVEIGRGGYR